MNTANADQIRSQTNRKMLLHWQALKDKLGQTPERNKLDPLDLKQDLLHHMFLTKVSLDPFAVKILVQGEYITQRAGQSLIGKTIDRENFGDGWEQVLSVYRRVVETEHPICTREKQVGANGWVIEAEVLHLPLLGPEGMVSYVAGSLDRLDLMDRTDGSTGSPENWNVTDEVEFDV